MSVHDYRCAHMDCDEPAIAVYFSNPSCFGSCSTHLRPLSPGASWIWPPPEQWLRTLENA